jgi:carbamoyltransferase
MTDRKTLTILGVNFSGADPNAALVIDGKIAAAVEEERFIREKHASGRFPSRAVQYCLEVARRYGRSVDYVAFGWDCPMYSDGRMARFYASEVNGRYDVDEATQRWQAWMQQTFNADRVTSQIHACLVENGCERDALPPVRFLSHHRTHAAGAYLLSGFEDAAVLTLDGSGEDVCTVLWTGRDGAVEEQARFPIPHSLGWYYAAITEFLGFQAYDGEYKVMGLAPYGRANVEVKAWLNKLLHIDAEAGSYALDPYYIHYGKHTYSGRYTDALVELMGVPPRTPETEPTENHKDIAYAAQEILEEIGVGLARRVTRTAGSRRVCLAGGTALNCKMSQRILDSEGIDDIFILPNAGDGGQALSAAVLLSYELTGRRPDRLRSVALGPSFSDDEIKQILNECLLDHTYEANVCERAAQDIACGKVVGWFQGAMEFGPRALGNRSILADPRHVASRDKVNAVVKYREYWRPFCPSLLAEAAPSYFVTTPSDAPFMAITLAVHADKKAEIPAVVHVDGTVRPQFVHQDTHPLYHELIRSFAALTNVPVLLNTSFNVKGEPIVCTPRDALRNFYSCGMDVLYLGSFRLAKRSS